MAVGIMSTKEVSQKDGSVRDGRVRVPYVILDICSVAKPFVPKKISQIPPGRFEIQFC